MISPLTLAKTIWECRYDPDQDTYLASGVVSVPDAKPLEFTQVYTRTGGHKAAFEYKDSLGHLNTGVLIQTRGTQIEQAGCYDDGTLFMTSASTFSNDIIKTVMHFL